MTEQINGYIDHDYKGHKVRLYGTVVSINEGDKTANMVFENGVSANGIPMEVIQIDEASLEGIKNAAHRAWGWLKGKFEVIGGMVRKIWNGITIPFNRAVNIGQVAANGSLPSGVGFYPSPQAYAEAQDAGVKISEQESPDRSGEDSNGWNEDEAYRKFWRNIFKEVIKFKNESNTTITGKVVKDFYLKEVKKDYGESAFESLKTNPWLNDFFGLENDINEMEKYVENRALQSLREEKIYIEDGTQSAGVYSYRSENIPQAYIDDVVKSIMTQLKAAFQAAEFNESTEAGKRLKRNNMVNWAETEFHRLVNYQGWDEDAAKKRAIEYAKELANQQSKAPKRVKPVMIWGAPGIGKTSIVQQTRSMFKNATVGEGTLGDTSGYNINILEVVLSKMTADDFTLPTKGEDEHTGDAVVINAVQSWIPCWHVSGNKSLDRIRDFAANLKMNTTQTLKNKGIDIKGDIENWKRGAYKNITLNRHNGTNTKTNNTEEEKTIQSAEEFQKELDKIKKTRKTKTRDNEITESFEEYFDNELENPNFEEKNDDNQLTDGGIIFFDELTRAPKGVMSVLMNLINDRKVGEGWVLGSHWIIVCAANRFYEMTQVENTWEGAFGTRFIQMTFVPKWEDWKNWAMGYELDMNTGRYNTSVKHPNKIDQEIIDFLETVKQAGINAWYEKTDDNVDADRAAKLYANPRSWQTASDYMVARAKELNPEQPYIRNPKTGTETVNLSREEKMDCIAKAVGIGADTYGQYKTWTNTRYYTKDMIDNIINTGTITGVKTKEVIDIESKGKAKLTRNIMDDYIPVKEDYKGNRRRVNVDVTTLSKLSDEIFDAIDWTNITNTQVANLLCYFAIITKVYTPGSTLFFNRQWKKIFTFLTRTYMDHKDKLPKDLQAAIGQALQANGEGNKDKYMKWMSPCHKVFIFVNGWEGMDDGEVSDSYSEELSKKDVRDEIEAD